MGNWWRQSLGEYPGRLMRCAPGTHEAAAEMVVPARAQASGVLYLASGTGAFLARLGDLSYAGLAAVELNVESFNVEGVAPQPVDLNSDFNGALPHDFGLVTVLRSSSTSTARATSFERPARCLAITGTYSSPPRTLPATL